MFSRFSRSFLLIVFVLFILGSLAFFHAPARAYLDPWTGELFGEGGVEKELQRIKQAELDAKNRLGKPKTDIHPTSSVFHSAATVVTDHTTQPTSAGADPSTGVHGSVIMSKLGNATAKAELGRATWKLLHTITLRYPEKPTEDERAALNSYFHLLSRLYPCGECASEFQQLLKKFPPQTSSRRAAATWLCVVHNQVNARLGKPDFDCAHLDATYDCGCGDAPIGSASLSTTSATSSTANPTSTLGDVIGHLHDPMDNDVAKDKVTGVDMIKGGR